MTAASASTRPRRAYGLIGVVTAILAIIIAEFVVTAAETAPRPGLSAAALSSVVPDSASEQPALTWTNAKPGPQGRASTLTAPHLLLVAACSGGGTISISLSNQANVTVDCSDRATAGPLRIDRQQSYANAMTVKATDGNPRYIVRLIASNS